MTTLAESLAENPAVPLKVYCVFEFGDLLAVFATRAGADAFVAANRRDGVPYGIEEIEVRP
jgi:hypothetical protein